MEYSSTLEYLVQRISSKTDARNRETGSLEELLHDKVENLGSILGNIEKEIQQREKLSQSVISQIYEHYLLIRTKVVELSFWGVGANASIDSRRNALERQLDLMKTEVRQERVRCWNNVSGLKREFRTWLKQYRDLLQRVRLVTG